MAIREALLAASNVSKVYEGRPRLFGKPDPDTHALDGINLDVVAGETLGLVGESGCGKTTLGKCLINLIPPTSGDVFYAIPGDELETAREQRIDRKNSGAFDRVRDEYSLGCRSKAAMRGLRKELQIVLQDPNSAMNPRMLVRDILVEPMRVHGQSRTEALERAVEALERVGLHEDHMWRYPHEFSGGQKQRICIARALALDPRLVVLDEPTSSLDVSVQAQILNLLRGLKRSQKTTYLFISHDLRVVRYMSDRIVVMYLGKVVEIGTSRQLESSPYRHPYTEALLKAVPEADPRRREPPELLKGEIPSASNPPSGCRFRTRCPLATDTCAQKEPLLIERESNHFVACHLR